MKRVFVHGIGCVSPAGWGMEDFRAALARGAALPINQLRPPGNARPLPYRLVPPLKAKQPFLSHPRLRRASPLSVFAASAVCQALGECPRANRRLAVVFCVTGGCVQFSRRFYDETWRNAATASPLVFPETVFNAPASHLSALLESTTVNYTYVGDPATVLQALATAADWITDGRVEDCLVVGAEENDWLTAGAWRHFTRATVCAEGAGAILLSAEPASVELEAVSDARLYLTETERVRAVADARSEVLPRGADALLCDSRTGVPARDRAEDTAWQDWAGPRLSPKTLLGEGLAAGAAWQCVAAIDALLRGQSQTAVVSVAGAHEQAAAARFRRTPA